MNFGIDLVAGIIGGLFSLAADLIPGFNGWYEKLGKHAKRWIMIGVGGLTVAVIVGLNCWHVTASFIAKYISVECSEAGITDAVEVFFYFIVGNQVTFLIAPTKQKGD